MNRLDPPDPRNLAQITPVPPFLAYVEFIANPRGAVVIPNHLLQENGSDLLQENGSLILL